MSGKNPSPSKLVAAIRKGYLRTVIDALDEGANIEEADMHGHPGLPLRTACFEGDLAIINELIERGADINAPGADGPGMPLRLAVRSKNSKVIALLLKQGAIVPENFRIPLELIEQRLPRVAANANAWATGNMSTISLGSISRRTSECTDALSHSEMGKQLGVGDINAQMRNAWVNMASDALKKNRSTIALLSIQNLTDPNGYLAALRAKGYTVIPPQ